MTSAGEGATGTPGDSGQQAGDTVKSREGLATELEDLAEELTAKSRELKRAQPDLKKKQTMASLWQAGLVVMREYADKVDRVLEDGRKTVNEEHAVGDEDTAKDVLPQLAEAVDDAIEAINAAIDCLERADQTSRTRSRCYRKAADELAELANHCDGLVVHLRGTEGLDLPPIAPD
jgi:chromosome segregation ATPase